jgi:hypothetical protein
MNDARDEELGALIHSAPSEVSTASIPENDRLEYRVSQINRIFPITIEMNEGYVEWLPIFKPPEMEETLGWLWVIRPDLFTEIMDATTDYLLKCVIREYMRPEKEGAIDLTT